jgi:enolase-phosphatase E1
VPITHLLLDIEGTTCPVSFVAEVLFPYAREHLASYLQSHGDDPGVAQLVADVEQLWAEQTEPEAQSLRRSLQQQDRAVAVVPYLHWLIDRDIKATPLKDLQGRIWEAGYADGSIVAPLFVDVPAALQRWSAQGLVLAVYSSGSVAAQQLLYGHNQAGDLRNLFSHWFDTRTGPKQAPSSYALISAAMDCEPAQILFISDAIAELEAATRAGLQVLFSDRAGNPERDNGRFEKISDYSRLNLNDALHRA